MYKHATERKIVYISLTLCVLMYCVWLLYAGLNMLTIIVFLCIFVSYIVACFNFVKFRIKHQTSLAILTSEPVATFVSFPEHVT